jgi:carboxypeptidase Q
MERTGQGTSNLRDLGRTLAATLVVALLLAARSTAGEPQHTATDTASLLASIGAAARTDALAWARLAELCDRIGPRLAGSPAFARAAAWAADVLRADGHEAVHLEPVTVPGWVRGRERLTMLAPAQRELPMLGLGLSVGAAAIEAPVVVVHSFAELGPAAKGAIVLYDVPMEEGLPTIERYGPAVEYRTRGASEAAKHGAVAALIRSVTTRSLATPHTGVMAYEEGVPRVPAAAITTEDAAWIDRLASAGVAVRLRLEMGAHEAGETTDHNVVGEIRGAERPDEIVVVGGHLDSWDVGQGANDDGVGAIETIETLRLIRALPRRPARTIRGVLFADEEEGLVGGFAYAKAHTGERIVAAVESDLGAGAPESWSFGGTPAQTSWFMATAQPVGLPAALGGGGSDIYALSVQGVLAVGLHPDDTHYFDIHHSQADTLDKIDPNLLRAGVSAVARLVWQLADAPGAPLPSPPPSATPVAVR